ncbi:MAG TPA: alkaline phosphatase family protein [Gemmatimonadaceae bacterium]|nr:alkaline phosphatase family protein [Gemmatimonadaceae bacterium]
MATHRRRPIRIPTLIACATAALVAGACSSQRASPATSTPAPSADGASAGNAPAPRPPIRHVFIIILENKDFATTFGSSSPAPYLADTLVKQGALLTHYYGIGHFSLDNYIAMISGQAPDSATQADCSIFTDFVQTGTAESGQVAGHGCVYPASVHTIADQLTEHGLTWKGYMEDMGNDPAREPATCGHVAIGAQDITNRASPKDQYATKHDPFMYFHSIIDSPACHTNVVRLEQLETDLAQAATTPNYAFITPDLCSDGHDAKCADGGPGGLTAANTFLRTWVPRIVQSPAFREDGLLIVTFDEATGSDATACCNEQPGPNTKAPGWTGPGGGRIGAVLLSPFITPGTVSDTPYNHYSMLKSVEELFGLPYLGFASQDGLVSFGTDVYTHPRASTDPKH